jgi:hypothetical protein
MKETELKYWWQMWRFETIRRKQGQEMALKIEGWAGAVYSQSKI